jgi:hypothetical protein
MPPGTTNNDVGQYVSIALDTNDRPGVAYYDTTAHVLKYTRRNNGVWETPIVVPTSASGSTDYGLHPSLTYNANNNPFISYYDATHGDLRYAFYSNISNAWNDSLVDSTGNKVLLSTQFWRNDAKYDDRAFHRFLDVMAALEKRGFHKDDKAVIDNWDKPEPFARCYIYMEDLQAAKKTKGALVSGSRVWCADNGASERDLRPSDSPKHVDEVLKYFDEYLARAKTRLHKKATTG